MKNVPPTEWAQASAKERSDILDREIAEANRMFATMLDGTSHAGDFVFSAGDIKTDAMPDNDATKTAIRERRERWLGKNADWAESERPAIFREMSRLRVLAEGAVSLRVDLDAARAEIASLNARNMELENARTDAPTAPMNLADYLKDFVRYANDHYATGLEMKESIASKIPNIIAAYDRKSKPKKPTKKGKRK